MHIVLFATVLTLGGGIWHRTNNRASAEEVTLDFIDGTLPDKMLTEYPSNPFNKKMINSS
jgi:hypothetical protein